MTDNCSNRYKSQLSAVQAISFVMCGMAHIKDHVYSASIYWVQHVFSIFFFFKVAFFLIRSKLNSQRMSKLTSENLKYQEKTKNSESLLHHLV